MDPRRKAASIDAAIEGTARSRFVYELHTNSAIFPIALVMLEVLHEGGAGYFLKPDFYAIAVGVLVQAVFLSRLPEDAGWARLGGNAIAPALYTAIEAAVDGVSFFLAPHHRAYWGFALAIGCLQAARGAHPRFAAGLLVAEGFVRSMFLLAIYAIFEALAESGTKPFFADASHIFIASAIALLGLASGVAAAGSHQYLAMLRELSRRFRLYSEWFLGRPLLEQALADPGRLRLRRCDRAILFADVRGFTAWAETQPPEAVASALNGYYERAEAVFAAAVPIRFKFAGDEVMAVFADARTALEAAHALSQAASRTLGSHGIGAGIGLHWGAVVEGLIGGADTKQFDVLGDPVNTAKRIEGAAATGEVLASSVFCAVAGAPAGPLRWLDVKGKSGRLPVHLMASRALTAIKPQNAAAAVG